TRMVGRRTTAVIPHPYSSRRRSSRGWRRISVKPARCSTRQKRFDGFEKLCPAAAALAAGVRPPKTTTRPSARMSGSYPVEATSHGFAAVARRTLIGAIPEAGRTLRAAWSFALRRNRFATRLRPRSRDAFLRLTQDRVGKLAIIDDPREC